MSYGVGGKDKTMKNSIIYAVLFLSAAAWSNEAKAQAANCGCPAILAASPQANVPRAGNRLLFGAVIWTGTWTGAITCPWVGGPPPTCTANASCRVGTQSCTFGLRDCPVRGALNFGFVPLAGATTQCSLASGHYGAGAGLTPPPC